jgi:hypothetical protein
MRLNQHIWEPTTRSQQMRRNSGKKPVRSRLMQSTYRVGASPQLEHRRLSLTPQSPNTDVRVLNLNGQEIAGLRNGARNGDFTGRGDISAIIFTINNESRTCDLNGLDWLQSSEHIGMSTKIQNGEPVCTLEDMTETVSTPDIFGSAMGQRCVYMSDQRGTSGFVCN